MRGTTDTDTAADQFTEVDWTAHRAVARGIIRDSFKHGWEDVVFELVKNAIDANASRVHIECLEHDLDKKRLFRIVDNGDGMSPEEFESHFCAIGLPRGNDATYSERGTGRLSCF